MFLTLFRKMIGTTPPPVSKSEFGTAMVKIAHLPSLPDTSTRAMALANDPGSSLADFSNLIKRDGAIATATLKLANSPIYSIGKPVEELHQAVLRLGLRTCSDLVTSIGMRGLFRNAKRETLARCELLWRHSFFTAGIASQLNVLMKLGHRGEEFTASLLHDLGRFMIALVVPESADAGDPLDFNEDGKRPAQETEVLGIDHCMLGYQYCQLNSLPPSVALCNLMHHQPAEAAKQGREGHALVTLVSAADHIANYVHRTHRIKDYDATLNEGLRILLQGSDQARWHNVVVQLPQVAKTALRATREVLKTTSL